MSTVVDNSQVIEPQIVSATDTIPPSQPRDDAAARIRHYWEHVANVADVTEKKLLFLSGIREKGIVREGLRRADISRATAYVWRDIDPEFRAAWDEAKQAANDEVRESIYDQAISRKNIVASIFYAKHNCPEYQERVQVDVNVLHRSVEEKVARLNRQPLQLAPASTKAIINAALGLYRQPVAEPEPAPVSPTSTTTDSD